MRTVIYSQATSTAVTIRDLTVKERILLHLFDYTRYAEEYEAPIEVTQSGIAEAVGIRPQHVTQYVKPLLEEGLLQEDTRHIKRRKRRRKVYFLTARGRQKVASLRSSLLKEEVPFRTSGGTVREIPLSDVYHEDRRGTPLPKLLDELTSFGYISEVVETTAPGLVDFTQEAPIVEEFYGREEELERVAKALDKAPMVVITGMPGIGKTALASKICEQVRGSRSLFWRRVRPWDRAVDLATRLGGFLKALGRPRLESYLGSSRGEELSQVEDILLAEFASMEALLVFDDVQEGREDVLDFLSLLHDVLKQQQDCSALLLSRTTPGFYSRREVEVEASVAEFTLSGLDAASATRLISEAGVSDALSGRLLELASGSPLFLKLLAKASTGERVERVWKSLEAYIAEEIEPSLTKEELGCLQIASFYQVPVQLQGLLLERGGGAATVAGLKGRGLLDAVAQNRYLLHDTLRDYFQKSLPAERSRELSQKVLPWLPEAAERAKGRREHEDAISFVENAILWETDPGRRFPILKQLGRLREGAGDDSGAIEAYRAASESTDDVTEKAGLYGDIAMVFSEANRLAEAEAVLEEGWTLLPPGPSEAGVRFLLDRAASVGVDSGDYARAWRDVDRVTSWLPSLEVEPHLEAYLAAVTGFLLEADSTRRNLSEAKRQLAIAVNIWREARPVLLIWPYDTLGEIALLEGRVADAIQYFDKALALAVEHGRASSHVRSLFRKAYCYRDLLGEYERAEELFQEIHNLALNLSPSAWIGRYWSFAKLYERQGRYDEAREALEYYLEQVDSEEGDDGDTIDDLAWMARLCLRTGDGRAAGRFLNRAKDLASENPGETVTRTIAWAQAAYHEFRGEIVEAGSEYDRAKAIAEETRCMALVGHDPLSCRTSIVELLLAHSRFLQSIGEEEKAVQSYEEAVKRAKAYGLIPLARIAEDGLRELGASSPETPD